MMACAALGCDRAAEGCVAATTLSRVACTFSRIWAPPNAVAVLDVTRADLAGEPGGFARDVSWASKVSTCRPRCVT